MKQNIVTVTRRFDTFNQYGFTMDEIVKRYNEDGWIIKQIATTSFEDNNRPVLSISLLMERD